MNPTNKKAPAVHPEIKCLIQPLAVKDLSNIVVLFPDADSCITIDTWNGYLLCDPGIYKSCISSNLDFELVEHDYASSDEKREQAICSPTSIRQMPAYNPDAEVNSLCMTISSWVSSMDRVNHSVDFSTISSKAMIDLVRQLTILEQTVAALRKSLAERDIK